MEGKKGNWNEIQFFPISIVSHFPLLHRWSFETSGRGEERKSDNTLAEEWSTFQARHCLVSFGNVPFQTTRNWLLTMGHHWLFLNKTKNSFNGLLFFANFFDSVWNGIHWVISRHPCRVKEKQETGENRTAVADNWKCYSSVIDLLL